MKGRSHSLSGHGAFYLALIPFVCVLTLLISGSSPAPLPSTDGPTRPIVNRVEQLKAPNPTAAPMLGIDTDVAEDPYDEAVEFAERADDDETERYLLRFDIFRRFNVAASGNHSGLYESSTDRAQALTPFRLRAFSGRGSPSA